MLVLAAQSRLAEGILEVPEKSSLRKFRAKRVEVAENPVFRHFVVLPRPT